MTTGCRDTHGRGHLRVIGATLAMALMAGVARAGPVEDGNAGIAAMERGAYDEAIQLFSRTIAAPSLSTGDREFAYLSRGKAYLAKNDTAHAVADLKEAVRLNPQDPDASAALKTAQSPSPPASGRNAAMPAGRDPWGVVGRMANRYYWMQVPGEDPYALYTFCEWVEPQQTLSCLVHNKKGIAAVTETKLDAPSGRLLSAYYSAPSKQYYGTAIANATVSTEYSFPDKKPYRSTQTMDGESGFRIVSERFENGGWKPDSRVTLVETTEDELIAKKLLKKKKKP